MTYAELNAAVARMRDSAYSECDADMQQHAEDRMILAAQMADELDDTPLTLELCERVLGPINYGRWAGGIWGFLWIGYGVGNGPMEILTLGHLLTEMRLSGIERKDQP